MYARHQSISMTLTGFRIAAHRSLSLAFTTLSPQRQGFWVYRQSVSLSIRGSSSGADGNAKENGRPTEDTRIHWASSDEGWLGTPQSPLADASPAEEVLSTWRSNRNDSFMGILVHAADSHYRYLELTPAAEAEEIKAAYRRLSKTYHPDTTSLPLEVAAEKFVRLKEAYTVLSSEDQRRLYDWQLAQKFFPQEGGESTYNSEYGKTMNDDGSRAAPARKDSDFIDNPVDTLGGRNMDLSDQAQAAIVFDAFAILVSVVCIIYAIFFKQT